MADHVLGGWRKRNGEKVVVRLTEYKGESRLDLRLWFLSDQDGEWHPTSKGVGITAEHIGEVVAMLQRASSLLAGKVPQRKNGAGIPAAD